MLTGRVPYHSDAPVAVAMMHIEQKPVSPREYNPELTPSVEKLIFKALSKNIGDRYQNGAEFNGDIMKLSCHKYIFFQLQYFIKQIHQCVINNFAGTQFCYSYSSLYNM
jgi:serine/threonine protein kinase